MIRLVIFRVTDEHPAFVLKLLGDRTRRPEAWRLRKVPRHRSCSHCRSEQIPGGHGSLQWIAGDEAAAGQADIDAEVWSLVRSHQKRSIDGFLVTDEIIRMFARFNFAAALFG